MSKRMTVVFDDDELYVRLKVAAARSGCAAKDIVAEALAAYFGRHGDRLAPTASERQAQRDGLEQVLAELGLHASSPAGAGKRVAE